jgi:hypothetical protein
MKGVDNLLSTCRERREEEEKRKRGRGRGELIKVN